MELPARRVALGGRRFELESERGNDARISREISTADRQFARMAAAKPQRADAVDLRRSTKRGGPAAVDQPEPQEARGYRQARLPNHERGLLKLTLNRWERSGGSRSG